MSDVANADQIAYWNAQSGRKWADDADKLDAMMAALSDLALAAAAPLPGETVIDIGCGSGGTALMLADRVQPGGHVLGVDVSQPMLAVAEARAAGRHDVRFTEADAGVFPFAPASADLVFSKFGVMFFEDPQAAFANIRVALKPGGRLVFICWRNAAENPFAAVPMGVAMKHLPPQPKPDPHAPGPFAFADAARVRGLLEGAGFSNVHHQPVGATMVVGRKAESAAKEAVLTGMPSRMLKDADDAVRAAVIAELSEVYKDWLTDAGVTFPARCWIVTAKARP